MRAVILAGGSGTRLWPLSRRSMPKQFLPLAGERSLFRQTVARVRPLVGDDVVVVTTADTAFLAARQLEQEGIDPADRVLAEPVGRNTAPAIGLAALGADPSTVLLVLPSDHAIRDEEAFRRALAAGARVADAGWLVTFGIRPDRPETGYGYIRMGEPLPGRDGAWRVARFVEKPDRETAEAYLADGGYAWNSGMFALRAGRLLEELGAHAPDVRAALEPLAPFADGSSPVPLDLYEAVPRISIDYAVMERSDRVAVIPVDPGWSDLGSFAALRDVLDPGPDGNVTRVDAGGEAVVLDGTGNLVLAGGRVVAAVGVSDTVIVDTPDALLVCARDRSQDVRRVVERLEAAGRPEVADHSTVHRPWGSYTVLELGERHQVKRITVLPGRRLSLQLHHRRAEQWVVVRGTARVTRGDEVLDLGPGRSVAISRGQAHRLENPGSELLEVIEVQTGDYLGEDDIVRLQDDFGRVPEA